MHYHGTIYRPPLEADTFLLPVTEGCTHNSCRFCNMYQGIPFKMLPLTYLAEYLEETRKSYGKYCEKIQRVYLVGADPFALSASRLLERIELIKSYLKNAQVFTMYARTDNLNNKSDEDLKALQLAGVDDLYMGVECGLNEVLASLNKGFRVEDTIKQCLRLNEVGIRHCDLLMLGTAGKGHGLECAKATARLENEIKPHKILVTTMSAFTDTSLDQDIQTGAFIQASEKENLEEELELLAGLELPDCWFWAAHPLDSIRIEGRLGQDRLKMMQTLEYGLKHGPKYEINRISRVGTL